MNMAIPLGIVGGRGFSLPLTLNYSSKVWSASKDTDYVSGSSTVAYASYGAGEFLQDWHVRISPGWTVGIAPLMNVRSFGIDPLASPGCGFNRFLTKLTVSLPGKGEIELRDDYTDGAPHLAETRPGTGNCRWYDGYRGRRWHASDGSGIIFLSDVDNAVVNGDLTGVLITNDGTRYRFVNGTAPGGFFVIGRSTSITDRNGNQISISYPNTNEVNYTDQLNRVTKIKKDAPDPQNGQPLALLVELPGFGGPRYYKLKSGEMSQNYRLDIAPPLPVINGAYNPLNYLFDDQWWAGGTTLFSDSYCLFIERIDTQPVVNELILPDNRLLRFKYNQYGEVAEVQLPTGGKMQYDYAAALALPIGVSLPAEVQTWGIPINVSGVDRAVTARRTYADGVALEGSWTYTYSSSTTEARAFSATGTLLRNERHFFMPSGRYLQPYNDSVNGTGYSLWSTGLTSRSELRNASNLVLSATESDWTQRASVSWWTGYTQQQPANDNRVNQQRRYLDNGMMAKVETSYDQYNNPLEVREYDFDQTLKRRTTTSYLTWNNSFNYATDDSIHMPSLPVTTTVFNGAGTQVSQTVSEYDIYSSDGNHALLTDYGLVSQHDSNYGTTKPTRGNVTRAGRWLNATGTFIYSYPRFDKLGNMVAVKNPNGAVSTVSFADDFGPGVNPGTPSQNPATPTYALPTLVTSPPPTPGAPVHTARSQYDYSTGLLTGFRDRNNVVTQTIYNDAFNRPTQVKSALGIAGIESHTTTYYAPATVFGITLAKDDLMTVSDLNTLDDASIKSWAITDGFGRTMETWKQDPQGNVKVITTYDALSRVKQTSNPFRPPSESAVYTTMAYDLEGRVTTVTTPDNGVVSTSYTANAVTVTDQAGKAKKSITDGLGRVIEIYEDPAGLNYLTSYTYDALDNLTTITQGTQTRTFEYDSLKRLRSATNPESGTVTYGYDNNSNLTQKTDALGAQITYSYDTLNRNTSINYPGSTPDVTRQYDLAINGKGRLNQISQTGTKISATYVDSYDGFGRPLIQRQRYQTDSVWSASYQTERTYNRAGNVTSQKYPSGHIVNYTYDSAGRVADFNGNLGEGLQRTYSTGVLYSKWGTISREQFGTNTPVYHKVHYNIRGQMCDVRASGSSDEWGGELGALVNHYSTAWAHCGSGTDNNGNVLMTQTIINSFYMEDRYTYDGLNRLTSVAEYQNGSVNTGFQQYTHDRWGNRTINPASWGVGINNKQFTVNTATNRLGVPVGQPGVMTYDNAGNLITDTYTGAGSRTYDAENRMITAIDNTGQTSRYFYDAEGSRVRRQVASSQEEWQIYGMEGELLAEYRSSSPSSAPEKEYGYRNGQLLVTATGRHNVALAANGAVATASSAHTCCGFSTSGAINGNNRGPWGNGEGWNDATPDSVPDWIQVDFAGSKAIDEINVFSLHDNYTQENTPTETQTFTLYGLLVFDVQYWNGSNWTTIPGGSVAGNNKVWRKFTFAPITTTKIRVWINAVPDSWSRVVEIQAFGIGSDNKNVQWLVADQLSSPRIVIDQTGTLANVKRHDYLPFGEELFAGTGGRTVALGYASSDGVRSQFTSKERDVETKLDYFLARYYSSEQGRFTSADEFSGGPVEVFARAAESNPTFYADLTNPQTLNKYNYCVNNPLRYVDPSGHQQQDTNSFTRWIQSLMRQLLTGKETYPEEKERRGPLSLDADEVNAKVTQAAGEAAKARADLVKMTGLDFGTLDLIEATLKGDVKGSIIGAVFFVSNTVVPPGGKAVLIGENMGQRVIPVAAEIGAKTYSPTSKLAANWLNNNARWIATQIAKGNRIFDIGQDANRAASKYYAKEIQILLKRGFQRVRVGTVTVGGKTYELYEWVKAAVP